ncbi:hypothetical protein G7046_g8797 [Stylonectria norvegica]|nr:hypothetical protein G7046_g8797 [Stylonectria norvegica]
MRPLPTRVLAREVSPGLVCRSCRLQRRQFASSTILPPAPPPSGITSLTSRRLILVKGPDAAKFLHGIVTANVTAKDGQPRREGFYTGFLNATGRVLYDVFVYPDRISPGAADAGDGFLIEVDADQATTLAKHIKRYKLRAKLAVRLLAEEEATVWHAWDDSAGTKWESHDDPTSLVLKDPRTPILGYRHIRLDQKTPELDLERSTEDAYTIRRNSPSAPSTAV